MIRRALSLIVTLIKLPIKLVLLPYRIVSGIFKLIFVLSVLLIVGGGVYFFVL